MKTRKKYRMSLGILWLSEKVSLDLCIILRIWEVTFYLVLEFSSCSPIFQIASFIGLQMYGIKPKANNSSNHVIIVITVVILRSLKCEVMSGFSSRRIYLKERWRPWSDLWSQHEWPDVIEIWLHLCISLAWSLRCIQINIVCALCWQLDASRDQKYKHCIVIGDRTLLGWNCTISSEYWSQRARPPAGGRSSVWLKITGKSNRFQVRNIEISVLLDCNKLI